MAAPREKGGEGNCARAAVDEGGPLGEQLEHRGVDHPARLVALREDAHEHVEVLEEGREGVRAGELPHRLVAEQADACGVGGGWVGLVGGFGGVGWGIWWGWGVGAEGLGQAGRSGNRGAEAGEGPGGEGGVGAGREVLRAAGGAAPDADHEPVAGEDVRRLGAHRAVPWRTRADTSAGLLRRSGAVLGAACGCEGGEERAAAARP